MIAVVSLDVSRDDACPIFGENICHQMVAGSRLPNDHVPNRKMSQQCLRRPRLCLVQIVFLAGVVGSDDRHAACLRWAALTILYSATLWRAPTRINCLWMTWPLR